MPTTTAHTTRVVEGNGYAHRECDCGWQSATFRSTLGQARPAPCPRDETISALETLQFHRGGLVTSVPTDNLIHLVRRRAGGGTPGPTLCGIDRFAKEAPGWSVGGGVTGPGIDLKPCGGCADVARTEFPGLPVHGSVGGRQMAKELER